MHKKGAVLGKKFVQFDGAKLLDKIREMWYNGSSASPAGQDAATGQ